jgi:spore coat polysaccharide biosynthesis predicted glycosyltransferase SpsG
MPATIRFVATAGPLDGRGHLGRALSLAEARWAPGTTIELELVGGTLTERERARALAVGLRQVEADAPAAPATVAVVDVPEPATIAARFNPARLAVFDDRDAFRGAAALVVQPSQGTWSGPGTAGAVLAGYEYVPIPAAIRQRRSSDAGLPRDGRRPQVLVCFGGSDPDRVTERLMPALAAVLDAEIEAVVGASYRGPTDGWPVPVRRDPPDLIQRLATADVGLLGAGTMKFEAACLARPMLLLAVADDQLPVGPAFAATGAARFLGDGRTVDPVAVADAVAALLADPVVRAAMAATAARVVDGDGADRIATAVERLRQPVARS